MNAITNALGTEAIDMPATPAAVWAVLQKINKMPRAA
jgi:CO/xanthine dehydrogenase Mo-binding subunit